ncbi:MAG TPA: MotA/TolQ/ExbB proton channel family protein [Stellaceae bacterium]|jgi:biopolymer transport protein ExbB|nr:MotA/TolQ/ExbB proton channel family protein [Stellaceae bacterium]
MGIDRLKEIAAASDGILYVMAFLLLIALTVIIERTLYLRLTIRRGHTVARAVEKLNRLDRSALESLFNTSRRHPLAALLAVPLHHPDLAAQDRMADMLEEAMLWQAPRIDSRLWLLDTIVTLAPLLGLLGTIVGMFNAFQILGNAASSPTAVTGDVAQALVATGCGLFIAVIGLVAFNSLNNDVRLIIHQMETMKFMLINRLAGVRMASAASHSGKMQALPTAARKLEA